MLKVTHGLLHIAKDLSLPYSEAVLNGHVFRFSVPERMARKRVDTFESKEPTTLVWLNTMTADDILIDVGGNIGMYSVYAGLVVGCRVYAFEPESLNYAELHKNLYLNELTSLVTAFCCAVSNRNGLDRLYLSAFRPAYSHHDAGENRWDGPVTMIAASRESRLIQGCMLVTLDQCVAMNWIQQPTHIKIDVDGLEANVIDGAEHVLQSSKLQTVLIETDFHCSNSVALLDRMQANGWHFSMDQVCISREGRETPTNWWERLRAGNGVSNIIYYRDKAKYDRIFAEAAQ